MEPWLTITQDDVYEYFLSQGLSAEYANDLLPKAQEMVIDMQPVLINLLDSLINQDET